MAIDVGTAWTKIQKYCDWQERCHQEVRDKLYSFGLRKEDIEEIIVRLIDSNYVNEERYSRAYARGKFNAKKWGKKKIVQELKFRKISDYCIKIALEEIDTLAYKEALDRFIEKKQLEYKAKSVFELKGKVARYCMGKGYESGLVWERVNELISTK